MIARSSPSSPPSPPSRKAISARLLAWLGVFVIGGSAFLYGAIDQGPPRTDADRVYALAQNFGCPVCGGQSVAESDSVVARNIRQQIARRVDEGRSDEVIISELEAAFPGNDYTPAASGLSSLVWILPVVAAAGALSGLIVVFRRWRNEIAPEIASHATTSDPDAHAPSKRRSLRVAVGVIGIALVATLAGVVLAQFSGSRGSSDQITGNIRESVRSRLFDAREAMGNQELTLAIEIYDGVLVDEPSNAEALTYRGWLTNLTGDPELARDYIAEAIAADPSFPDARVFGASLALANGEPLVAYDELAVLNLIATPLPIAQLIEVQQLDLRVAEAAGAAAVALVEPVLGGAAHEPLEIAVRYMVLAAEHLAATERLDEGLALFEALLVSSGDDPDVLVALGWFLARASVGVETGMTTARGYLDAVIESNPMRADALVYRALVHLQLEDLESARADLAAYDGLNVVRNDLDRLLTETGLREVLA